MGGIRHDLQRTIYQCLKANRDGSFETQKSRQDILYGFAKTLVRLGYGLRDIHGLKRKHIDAVLADWQLKGLSQATIKNRMAVLRHLCERLNKSHLIEKKNAALGIANRVYVPIRNRALVNLDFSVIAHPLIRVSIELQRVFGLRREEALKIQPWKADKGDSLYLQASWCKGGRERHVPIRTEEQRYWLDQAKTLVKYQSDALIPRDQSYIQHRYTYTNVTSCNVSDHLIRSVP